MSMNNKHRYLWPDIADRRLGFPTVTYWASDWGDIRLPDDFPSGLIRVTGWYDRRFTLHTKVADYLNEQELKLRNGYEEPGFRAPSFGIWMVSGSIPNRLKGVTVNSRGEEV